MTHSRHGGPPVQVLCWRSVCVTLLVCVLLPEFAHSAKTRCGAELIADLQFVCGDRGFYRGNPGALRSAGPRRRGKGIVDQCCVKGCDLQYLEHYCATPKRERRHTRHTGHTPSMPHTEDQSWMIFLRQYETNRFVNKSLKFTERLKERALYQRRKLRRDSPLPDIHRDIPKPSESTLKHRRLRHRRN